MYRFIEGKIQDWIDHSKKTLLIDGVRQVGKTYVIREMLKRNHIAYFEINFIERPDILEKLKANYKLTDGNLESNGLINTIPQYMAFLID